MEDNTMISWIKKNTASKKKILFVFLIILGLQLVLYEFLYLRANWITPPGHLHLTPHIDSYYPGVILQGKLGAWAHTYLYTTLPTQKIYTYLFFIGAGKIAALFHIDPVAMYEITRVAGAIAALGATYWLITLLFPNAIQIPAMIFTMMFETGPLWTDLTHWQLKTIWFIPPLLSRHFYLPHHLWGEALGLALLCVVIRATKKPSRIAPVLIIILAVAAPLTNPTFSAILVPCVFAPWLVYAAVTKTLKRSFLPIAFAITGIGCVGLFTMSQFSVGPPWNTVTMVEKSWWNTDYVLIPFIQSYSLFYPFIAVLLILTPLSWKRWSQPMRRTFILALSWSVLPVALIYLAAFPWFPLMDGRIATDLSQVPAGILSTSVFYAAGQMGVFRRPLKLFVTCLFLLGVGVSLFLSVAYFKQMIQQEDHAVYGNDDSWVEYPTVDLWNGVMALKNVPLWSHIMICPRVADILPVYLPVRVYQGSTSEGLDWITRGRLSYVFYTGEMSREDLRKLFTDNAISYVFYGPEENAVTKTPAFYPDVLTPIYTNPDVTIYKVLPIPQ